jgi:hypothetical protein
MSYPQPPETIVGMVEYYDCSESTIKRHRAKGAPLNDLDAMLNWLPNQKDAPAGMKRRLADYKAQRSGDSPQLTGDADWAEFEKMVRTDDPKESMVKIARARDFVAFKFEKASRANEKDDMGFYANLLSKFEGVFHDAALRAKKLGLDEGELLPRPEVERIAWALAYWTLRAVDQNLDALSSKLAALSPGLEAGPIRAVLEPELLSARFLTPYARAAKIQSGVTLPEWLVAKMRESVGDYLSNGEQQFDSVTAEQIE